jgi:hypothetical protein
MSFRTNVKFIIASSLLLTLASCGNDHKSSSRKGEVNPICADVDCMSSVNWKILLHGRSFPDKSRIDINGTTVYNKCVAKQKYEINRQAEPQELYLENFYVPTRGELKINIVDLGDCSSETPFLSDDNVNFEINKTAGGVNEVLINL